MNKTKTRMQYHRKQSGKTNYKKRLKLLQSRKDRLVIRRTNKYLVIQLTRYEPAGDKILISATSKELVKLGWKHSCKNIPACYLAGLILGTKATTSKIKGGILDLGLQTSKKGSRLYAALKGVIDSGVNIPSSEDIFPSEDRINGKHISNKVSKDFESIKSKIIK